MGDAKYGSVPVDSRVWPWRMNGVGLPLNSSAQMKSYRVFLFFIYVNYSWIMHLADYTAISIWVVFFTL